MKEDYDFVDARTINGKKEYDAIVKKMIDSVDYSYVEFIQIFDEEKDLLDIELEFYNDKDELITKKAIRNIPVDENYIKKEMAEYEKRKENE